MDEHIDGYVTDVITITRLLTPDGEDLVRVRAEGDSGLVTQLGMLALTQNTLLQDADDDA